MMFSPRSSLHKLNAQLEQSLHLFPQTAVRAEHISKWSVGEHLEHTIEITDYVIRTLCESANSTDPLKPLTFRGRALLVVGVIPRGVAGSPRQFLPKGKTSTEINEQLISLRIRIDDLLIDPLKVDYFLPFAHPTLGALQGRQWLRFLCIHQQHHLKIIKEILRNVSPIPPATSKSK